MLPPADNEVQKRGERKKFKNLRFVSLSLFTHLLAGGSLREVLEAGETRAVALQGGRVLIDAAEFASLGWNGEKRPIWRVESMPHVAIDRVNSSSAYYETGQVRFNQGCGLAVLATGDTGLLHALLVELGQAGLGGRRSKGLGQFTVEPPTMIELPSATSERLVMLSRYLPTGGELQAGVLGEHAAYGLEHVNGWLYAPGTTPQRRKPVWMLGAGSVVQSLAGVPPQGAIVDLKPVYASNPAGEPRHAIWRHGLALSVGAPLKEQV
jgi:CRISPR-associated protein Csm4